jgi:hypothetical protein
LSRKTSRLADKFAPEASLSPSRAAGTSAGSSSTETSGKTRKASKPAGDKICKRLSQGKVCMTAEKWKAYEEQF